MDGSAKLTAFFPWCTLLNVGPLLSSLLKILSFIVVDLERRDRGREGKRKKRQGETRESHLSSAALEPCKCLQQPEPGQAQVRCLAFNPGLRYWGHGRMATQHPGLPHAQSQDTRLEVKPELTLGYGMWAPQVAAQLLSTHAHP